MDTIIAGGCIRLVQGILAASPTFIIGLFIASLLRYYLRSEGTHRLFGGNSLWALPQSWLVGMLLPVCSIGVIPIIREMKRQGIRPGAITAFALAAPLFNPLSLLYGLTLSRPVVILGFAFGSLIIVTILGIVWDRAAGKLKEDKVKDETVIGLARLKSSFAFATCELAGPSGGLAIIAVLGLFLLGAILPHGALQTEVEQLDPMAPLKMSIVSVLVYATPILAMSQLGMMFDHGNSPGAAFALLLLGTGMNLATLAWLFLNFKTKATAIWFGTLMASVLAIAYAVDRPLIPPGVEAAGHTHAFDIYTNPLHSGADFSADRIFNALKKPVSIFEWIAGGFVAIVALTGFALRFGFRGRLNEILHPNAEETEKPDAGIHRHVSSRTVGLTCLAGVVAFSVVGCFAYYPDPDEVLKEIRMARVEVLTAASSGDYEAAKHWIPIMEEWSRKLEVGYAIRNFELRPYQQVQTFLLRKKLENLEHAIEHAAEFAPLADSDPDAKEHLEEEEAEIEELRTEISLNARRVAAAFRSPDQDLGPSGESRGY